jgi:hypothetical protein
MANKDNMKKWEEANKRLADDRKKREAERGTSRTTNPLMKDFKERMEKREVEQAKKDANKAGRKFSTAEDRSRYVAPNGKEYAGPGYGPNSGGESKSKAAASTPSATRKRRATGRDAMMSERQREIAEREERKRKQAQEKGGSNVVGS